MLIIEKLMNSNLTMDHDYGHSEEHDNGEYHGNDHDDDHHTDEYSWFQQREFVLYFATDFYEASNDNTELTWTRTYSLDILFSR